MERNLKRAAWAAFALQACVYVGRVMWPTKPQNPFFRPLDLGVGLQVVGTLMLLLVGIVLIWAASRWRLVGAPLLVTLGLLVLAAPGAGSLSIRLGGSFPLIACGILLYLSWTARPPAGPGTSGE